VVCKFRRPWLEIPQAAQPLLLRLLTGLWQMFGVWVRVISVLDLTKSHIDCEIEKCLYINGSNTFTHDRDTIGIGIFGLDTM